MRRTIDFPEDNGGGRCKWIKSAVAVFKMYYKVADVSSSIFSSQANASS